MVGGSSLRISTTLAFVFLALGCGSPPPPAPAKSATTAPSASGSVGPQSAQAAAPSATVEAAPKGLEVPTECAKKGTDECVPPPEFTKRLCEARSTWLALALFAKGSPWTRMYLARNTETWDASGRSRAEPTKLAFDEEVLVLAYRAVKPGGLVINGASGSYDVLRWDGACATLTSDEVRKWYPPKPGFAEIPWPRLEDELQEVLLKEGRIALKEGEMKKACKGLSSSQSTPACERARKSLSKAIVEYVRAGGAVPTPKPL